MSIGMASRKLNLNYSTAKSIVQKMRKRGTLLKKSKYKKIELFKVCKDVEKPDEVKETLPILFKSADENFKYNLETEKIIEKKLIDQNLIKNKLDCESKTRKKMKSRIRFPKKLFTATHNQPEKQPQHLLSISQCNEVKTKNKFLENSLKIEIKEEQVVKKEETKKIIKNKIIISDNESTAFNEQEKEEREISTKNEQITHLINYYDDLKVIFTSSIEEVHKNNLVLNFLNNIVDDIKKEFTKLDTNKP